MVNRVGEGFIGNLPYILGELKKTLESLLPVKYQSKRSQSSLAVPPAEKSSTLTFKWERAGFLNALNMVYYCQRLANKPAPPHLAPTGLDQLAKSLTQCMQSTMLNLGEKFTAALTEQANFFASALEGIRREKPPYKNQPTYAQSTTKGVDSTKQVHAPQMRKLREMLTQPPPLFLSVTLKQKP